MANIQSQIKRNRQNEKKRLRNRDFRGAARTAVKDALASITSGQESQAAVSLAISTLDKAARKGAIHHRNAARRKSRLIKRLAAMGQRPAAGAAAVTPKGDQVTSKTGKQSADTKARAAARKTAPKAAAKKTAAKKTSKK